MKTTCRTTTTRHKETLGAIRPQPPDQGNDSPGPSLGETAYKDISNKRRLSLGITKVSGFWPKKAGKIPRKKLAFSKGLFPGFPRMRSIRVGRQRRPGQKHNGSKLGRFPQTTAGNCFISASGNIRRRGCRGSSPAAGSGAAEAPGWPSLQIPICLYRNM